MSFTPQTELHQNRSDLSRAVLVRFLQVLLVVAFQAAVLFLSAGRVEWVAAWVYVAAYLACVAVNAVVLLPKHPEMIAERAAPKENVKSWDKTLSGLVGVASMIALVVAGMDYRFAWSPGFALGVEGLGLAFLVLGYALFSWAMASNEFFSTLVRIQDDRGHAVASGGPYRFIRHPGYAGWVILSAGGPLLLGSLWALVPTALSVLLMVLRTSFEDATLQAELSGYTEYAAHVRFKLVPGVW
ncbi:MAG: isoprenylcysteine carboxylmethyltransferase family protein [Chloroflexi bacterium]|nr:isoprenylcysteine carboxylmethyltransferase family protein [Chloroflexota bacterium]